MREEYTSYELRVFCSETEIVYQLTVHIRRNGNGVRERKKDGEMHIIWDETSQVFMG